ncbi:MAG: acyl-CoA dehydrogenase family protein [Haloplanus sp.]|jgi:alkylation response protein AidB-like acyl-CoA dehydrogenase
MLSLSAEQRMLVDTCRDLAESEFADDAFTWGGETPWENIRTLADHGLLGVNFDEEYGGGGMSEFEVMLMTEVIGRVCPDTARFVNSAHMIAARAIDMFGSEAAKQRYLPGVVDGEYMISIVISEPGAGSDVKAMETEIEETDDGDLYLSGEKIWVSWVPESRAGVVWTKFPDDTLGTVVMDFDDPGVEVTNHFTNMAGHTQTQFTMDDVHIPEEHVLVRGRDAFKEQLKALNWERLSVASYANTIAACALDKALEYAQDRVQFDQPIADFQGMEWKLADMLKELELSRSITYQTAEAAVAQGRVPDPLGTHIANLYAGEMVERVVSEALQVHGANGYQQGHPLEYLYRLQRGYRLGGGTDEIQKNTIARRLKDEGVPRLT